MYLQTERFHQVGYWQAVVCSDAILIEALRITRACSAMQRNEDSSSLTGCMVDDCRNKNAAKEPGQWMSTGICILRSWFITDSPTYTSPMAPPLAAKPPAVPTLRVSTEPVACIEGLGAIVQRARREHHRAGHIHGSASSCHRCSWVVDFCSSQESGRSLGSSGGGHKGSKHSSTLRLTWHQTAAHPRPRHT